jgi:hypothetical protein
MEGVSLELGHEQTDHDDYEVYPSSPLLGGMTEDWFHAEEISNLNTECLVDTGSMIDTGTPLLPEILLCISIDSMILTVGKITLHKTPFSSLAPRSQTRSWTNMFDILTICQAEVLLLQICLI